MNLLNASNDVDSKITSRYTIVIAAAKRARQLIEGDEALCKTDSDKPVSIAVTEMSKGKLLIIDKTKDNDSYFKALREQLSVSTSSSLDDTF